MSGASATTKGMDGVVRRLAERLEPAAIARSLAEAGDEAITGVRRELAATGDDDVAQALRAVARNGGLDILAPADAAFAREFGTRSREAIPFAASLARTARAALRASLDRIVRGR
ncbi:MAG: hypothetical protein R3D02_13710 [Hyphomicrobiales bacterium]